MSAGNVLNFGADPLGNDDSYPAFQAALDSPHAVEVPPGYYYISQPIRVNKPKIIKMTRPLLEPFDIDGRRRPHRGPGPNVMESHSRLWTDQNINMWEIRAPDVHIDGGTYDFQKVIGWDKACFYYPAEAVDQNNRANGWGGSVVDFIVIGNFLDLMGLDNNGLPSGEPHTGCAFLFDFQSENAVPYGYWTQLKFSGKVYGVDCGFRMTPRHPSISQFANTFDIDLEVGFSKQAIKNESVANIALDIRHQARAVFMSPEEADSRASVESDYGIEFKRMRFYDFHQSATANPADVTGNGDFRYAPTKYLNITGDNNHYSRDFVLGHIRQSIALGDEPPLRPYGQIYMNQQGDWQHPLKFGGYFFWSDARGRLRAKRAAPLSDDDGWPASG